MLRIAPVEPVTRLVGLIAVPTIERAEIMRSFFEEALIYVRSSGGGNNGSHIPSVFCRV